MARSNALGSWLNESKRKDTRRQRVPLSTMDRHRLSRELRWWTARGALWMATLVVAVSADVAGEYSERSHLFLLEFDFFARRVPGAMGCLTLPEQGPFVPLLPCLALLSIFWTAWLPTYAHFRRAELQGRKVRMRGRERYIVCLSKTTFLPTHLLTRRRPIDITGCSVGGENAHDKPDCVTLVPSFRGFAILALSSCFRGQPHLLHLHTVLRDICEQGCPFSSFNQVSDLSQQISIYSFLTLRLHRAPAVRLIDSSSSRASTPSTNTSSQPSHTPPPHFTTTTNTTNARTPSTSHSHVRGHGHTLDPPTLDNLSLSSASIPLRTWHASGPVFGHPSLRPATIRPSSSPPLSAPSAPSLASASTSQSRDAEMRSRDDDNDDAMDWTPTVSPVRPELASRGLLSPRKATDVATGLEMLLERANIVDSSELRGTSVSSRARRRGGVTRSMQTWSWGWVYALSLVPLVGVLYYHLR